MVAIVTVAIALTSRNSENTADRWCLEDGEQGAPAAPAEGDEADEADEADELAGDGGPRLDAETLLEATRSAAPDAEVGVLIADRASGQTGGQAHEQPLLELNSGAAFQSASVVKLLIALEKLAEGDADEDATAEVNEMLTRSDDDIASRLWNELGRDGLVTEWASTLGLSGTEPPDEPGQWGATTTTARDVATVYRHIACEADDEHREAILDALQETTRTAADGFDQRFGIAEVFDEPWAVKQGWSRTGNATAVHSTGLAGPELRYIVVMLTEHDSSVEFEQGTRAVTAGLDTLDL